MTRNRAKLSILSELLSFPTVTYNKWEDGYSFGDNVIIGDLVSLNSAPDSKYYLSWVKDKRENKGYREWLLESIEDGELCWWSNVGFNVYSRKRVIERPTWKWSDKQYEFNDRWLRVFKRNHARVVLPLLPDFKDDGSVILNVRIRWSFSEGYSNPKTFQNWNKLLFREMDAYYKECVEGYSLIEQKRKEALPI